ncbi:hypothetical protein Tbd_2515 [Thiobacillus denitrificans ATCC 25259]|uniref:DUF1425 domain-containing protein n=1 Tax=Thiobacillus denitrificans (strain ATCC 25259 / T1) TaxID=292415 RepID=Q3SFY8_THIDA|nr:YcfL family protein [Thiobacillus denitrificans]AAZ98468.1 hypothetical protein Tbd_2515 [Thiobacillus denitrificans ATCC 25259]
MTLRKPLGGALAALSLWSAAVSVTPAAADTIASKIEAQGEMTYLKVAGLRQAVRNELLTIQAEVANDNEGQQTLYYRFRWLDADGFSVWDDEAWKPLLFHGKGRQVIQAVAPTPRATDFRLVVQSPENSTAPASTW